MCNDAGGIIVDTGFCDAYNPREGKSGHDCPQVNATCCEPEHESEHDCPQVDAKHTFPLCVDPMTIPELTLSKLPKSIE